MDIINQSFVDKRTGTIHTIINVINGIALTDNIEKIPVNMLMDVSLYSFYKENSINESNTFITKKSNMDDIVDPNDFFNDNKVYNAFADKIRNIDTSKIPDEDTTISMPSVDLGVDNSVSAVYTSSVDDEMDEVARKYGVNLNNQQATQKQNEAFSKYLDDDDGGPVMQIDADTHKVISDGFVNNSNVYESYVKENPVHVVFKQVKRSLPFKAIIVQEGNLPRLDFIEMMEDSYETSIIDFLADDYVNKILSNPGELKIQIKDQIMSLLDKKNGIKRKPIKTVIKPTNQKVKPESEPQVDVIEKPKRAPRKNKV